MKHIEAIKRFRKSSVFCIGIISAIQAAATTYIFARHYSRKNAEGLILAALTIFNVVCSAFCFIKFTNENLPKKKLPKGVTYEDSDEDIFDFDIDALTDEELEALLK